MSEETWHGDSHGAVDLGGIGGAGAAASGVADQDQPQLSGSQGDANGGGIPTKVLPSGEPLTGALVVVGDDTNFTEIIGLSAKVPVLVLLTAPGNADVDAYASLLAKQVWRAGGSVLLVVVDATKSPSVAQAFQLREVPALVAVVAGQAMPVATGLIPPEQLAQVIPQVRQAATELGVTGGILPGGTPGVDDEDPNLEPELPPLSPELQAGFDAIEAGNFVEAVAAYEHALAVKPNDELGLAGLANAKLLLRLDEAKTNGAPAAATHSEVMHKADQLFSTGDHQAAFDILLEAFTPADVDLREQIRTRVLEYFAILGPEEPLVGAIRRRLASLLY